MISATWPMPVSPKQEDTDSSRDSSYSIEYLESLLEKAGTIPEVISAANAVMKSKDSKVLSKLLPQVAKYIDSVMFSNSKLQLSKMDLPQQPNLFASADFEPIVMPMPTADNLGQLKGILIAAYAPYKNAGVSSDEWLSKQTVVFENDSISLTFDLDDVYSPNGKIPFPKHKNDFLLQFEDEPF